MTEMATLDRITVFPVKSLDPHQLDSAVVRAGGGLSYDREFAIVDKNGNYVNGKREPATHRLRSTFNPEGPALTVHEEGTGAETATTFSLADGERGPLELWLSEFFAYDVHIQRDEQTGYPDDMTATGPTVVSTETLRAVASWFEFNADEARRRLRPNLVVDAPVFWGDRLYSITDRDRVVPFHVGQATFEGVNPCQRCVVPGRDPWTGAETPGFRQQFVERRRETLPDWAGDAWFDHYFRLMVNTDVPASTVGDTVAVGDPVDIGRERSRKNSGEESS
jgi:uncharacterized protein YcbX